MPSEDDQLMLAFKGGEVEALGQLVERYAEPLRQYLSSRVFPVRDPDALNDLVQEVWRAVIRSAPNFRAEGRIESRRSPFHLLPPSHFSNWLAVIAHRQAIDSWRQSVAKQRRRPEVLMSPSDMEELLTTDDTPAEAAASRELAAELWAFFRESLGLRPTEELSFEALERAMEHWPEIHDVPFRSLLRRELQRELVAPFRDEATPLFLLWTFYGLTTREIAQLAGLDQRTVSTRLYRARRHLRSRLERWLRREWPPHPEIVVLLHAERMLRFLPVPYPPPERRAIVRSLIAAPREMALPDIVDFANRRGLQWQDVHSVIEEFSCGSFPLWRRMFVTADSTQPIADEEVARHLPRDQDGGGWREWARKVRVVWRKVSDFWEYS